MNDVAGAVAKDGVYWFSPSTAKQREPPFEAVELFVAECPAARPLVQVSSNRTDIPDLRRSHFGSCIRERGVYPPRIGIGREIGERRCTNSQAPVSAFEIVASSSFTLTSRSGWAT